MITKLTRHQRDIVDSNSGMKRYLESLLRGKDFTPRSWLYEDQPADQILKNWEKKLSVLERSSSSYDQRVFQFDTSQLTKWGPQGGVPPISKLMDIVEEGFKLGASPRPKVFDDPNWIQAKEICKSILSKAGLNGTLRPASYKHVLDDMRARDTLESNSGWPLFTRRSKPEVVEDSILAASNGSYKTYPAIALFRNYNNKTRLVWMFPMSTNLVEGSFFQPLQSALVRAYKFGGPLEFFAPWIGFEEVRRMVGEHYSHSGYCAASDFTSTDAHFTKWSSLEACELIQHCFQPEYRDAIRDSILHMHSIPLVIGPDRVITGEHGVSSGSNWTNFIETLFDWILAKYVAIVSAKRRGKSKPYFGLYAIGDDMSWGSMTYWDAFAEFLQDIGEQVGQIIKADKTTNERDYVKSLQRLFQRGYRRPDGQIRAVYPTIRALKSSVYPERFHDPRKWSVDMFCARQFMILENCVDHPLFEEFVEFVVHGHPALIPFAQKSASELDRILRESKLLPGLNPTYNQERRDQSLASFASIKFAAKL